MPVRLKIKTVHLIKIYLRYHVNLDSLKQRVYFMGILKMNYKLFQ